MIMNFNFRVTITLVIYSIGSALPQARPSASRNESHIWSEYTQLGNIQHCVKGCGTIRVTEIRTHWSGAPYPYVIFARMGIKSVVDFPCGPFYIDE